MKILPGVDTLSFAENPIELSEHTVLAPGNDLVNIKTEDHKTTIEIRKERVGVNLLGQNIQTKIFTEIIKDNKINAKEMHIKKVFITDKENNEKEYIIREIFVDKISEKKVVNERKLTFALPNNESLEGHLKSLTQQSSGHEISAHIPQLTFNEIV